MKINSAISILENYIKKNRIMRNYDTTTDYEESCEEKCVAMEVLINEVKKLTSASLSVGDRIRIVENTQYNIPNDVRQFLGKDMTVAKVCKVENCYEMEEDKGQWVWDNSMFDNE